MDDALFKALTTCDAKQSWVHIRETVVTSMIGENVFPVPFLEDFTYYEPSGVVLKEERSAFEKLARRPASVVIAGTLADFVREEYHRGLTDRLARSSKDKKVSIKADFDFQESAIRNGVKKTVTLQLLGCEKWNLDYVPRQGDLVLDMSLKGYSPVGKFYLIDQIYYVNDLKLHVTIGEEEDEYVVQGKTPVGFRLIRYWLYPDGTLWEKKRVEKKTWKVKWTQRSLFRKASEALHRTPSKPKHLPSGRRVRKAREMSIQTSTQRLDQ